MPPSSDLQVRDLPSLLQPGDLLVFNDTRVIPARLFGHQGDRRAGRGPHRAPAARRRGARAAGRQQAAASPAAGSPWTPVARRKCCRATRPASGTCASTCRSRWNNWLQHAGRLPLPPYIQREPGSGRCRALPDRVRPRRWARSRHRPPACISTMHCWRPCARAECELGHVTLHVGAGTFQPMRVEDIREHRMHSEWINVGAELVAAGAAGRAPPVAGSSRWGPRCCARSKVRWSMASCNPSPARPASSSSRAIASAAWMRLLTNFHLPESTLLMLVSAFAGKPRDVCRIRARSARAATASSAMGTPCCCSRRRIAMSKRCRLHEAQRQCRPGFYRTYARRGWRAARASNVAAFA
jgi:S-adenosylmethionine:tRNA ribosyltransferase-isomerase